MIKRIFSLSIFLLILGFQTFGKEKDTLVLIQTNIGDLKVKLYKETPIHRSNFIKIAQNGTLDSTLFHRVIKGFMIQGGDPNSKTAAPGQPLGNGGPGYTLPAEILPQYFHKKGALAAARKGDNMNPEQRSSGSQFYIVQGKVLDTNKLNQITQQVNQNRFQKAYQAFFTKPDNSAYLERAKEMQKTGNQDGMKELFEEVKPIIESQLEESGYFAFTPEQIKTYTTVGGTPHLDGNYTVFGEIVEGMEVVDKLAVMETGANDRPVKDIRMSVKLVIE